MNRIVIPLLLVLFCGTTSTYAQVKLVREVPDGEKSTSTTVIKSEQTLTIAGMTIPTSSRQKVTINSENGNRSADGRITIKQKITTLKADIDVNGQQLSFDSAKPDAPPPGTAIDVLLEIYGWHCRHHESHITSLRVREGW